MPANRPVLIDEDTPIIDALDEMEARDPGSAYACTACGDGTLEYLGTLGKLTWCRCRTCGAEQSISDSDLEYPT